MRNSLEITRKYQIGYMILHHLFAVIITAVLQSIAAWYFLDKPIARYVVGAVFTVVYGFCIYGIARKLSLFDNKEYTPLRPNLKWGVIWGLAIASTVAVFILIYRVNWTFFTQDGSMTNLASIAVNLLFYLWTAPYFGFMSGVGGHIDTWVIILMLVVPVISSTLGYYAGIKKFDIIEKLDSLTFEKDDDDE